MKDSSVNKFSVYLAGLSEFARLQLRQHVILLRNRTLIIYCADGKELEKTLECLDQLTDGLTLIADRVVFTSPDCRPIVMTEHYCHTLAHIKLTKTRNMLEELFTL